MASTLPLDKMTVAEKLRILEEIWDDLQRTSEEVPLPAWHGDVLAAREDRLRQGKGQFHEWTEAQQRIRENVR